MVHGMVRSRTQLNDFHSPTQKHQVPHKINSSLVVLVVGVWVMLVWLRGWCVDSETVGPSYLYFSLQSLPNHMKLNRCYLVMLKGLIITQIFSEGTWEMSKIVSSVNISW